MCSFSGPIAKTIVKVNWHKTAFEMFVTLTADVPVVPSTPSCDNSAVPKVSLLNNTQILK
jgi:hypothetical protein